MSIGPVEIDEVPFRYRTLEALGDWAPEQRAFIGSKLFDYNDRWLRKDFAKLAQDLLVQTDWMSMLMVNFEDGWHHIDECVDPTPGRWMQFPSGKMANIRRSNTLFFSNDWMFEFSKLLDPDGEIYEYRKYIYKKSKNIEDARWKVPWKETGSKKPWGQLLFDLRDLMRQEVNKKMSGLISVLPNWAQHLMSDALSLIGRCDILDICHPMLETMRNAILAGAIPCDVQKRNGEEKLVVFWIHPFPPKGWEEICGVQ